MCAFISVDPSVIKKSFDAHGVVEISPGMSKGAVSFFTEKTMQHCAKIMQNEYGIDVTNNNITVVTQIDLEKAIDILATAKNNLK